jgi:hypothetical protein
VLSETLSAPLSETLNSEKLQKKLPNFSISAGQHVSISGLVLAEVLTC